MIVVMPNLKFFKDISKNSVAEAGGKGASLGEMTSAGIPVPPGFVVLAGAFDRFVEETHLKEEIAARLAEVNPADMNSVDRASNVLRDVIHDTPMPADLRTEILEAFDLLFETSPRTPLLRGEGNFVAVRSSATAEDSSIASWAGELETYLNTTQENVVERVKQCWSSLFTPRAIFYRHEKNLLDHYVSVAVVVQTMVQSEISGIAFTVHPVTEDYDQMIIEAGYGLGEAIVGGQVTPDSYVVKKSEMSIMDIMIGGQSKKLVKGTKSKEQRTNDDGLNEWIELAKEEGGRQKLTGRQIIELAELCKKIETHYGFPCDIEWAFAGGKFFITQSRPITTLRHF
jgi:pyruvate,water dikinase